MYSFIDQDDCSYLCTWTVSNCLETNEISIQLGTFSWKTLTWENQHHSLDHVYLGCTQRECKTSKVIVNNYRSMFESRISAGCMEKLPQKSYLLGLTTWKVMQRNAWKDIASWRIKTTQQLYEVATTCMDDHQFK